MHGPARWFTPSTPYRETQGTLMFLAEEGVFQVTADHPMVRFSSIMRRGVSVCGCLHSRPPPPCLPSAFRPHPATTWYAHNHNHHHHWSPPPYHHIMHRAPFSSPPTPRSGGACWWRAPRRTSSRPCTTSSPTRRRVRACACWWGREGCGYVCWGSEGGRRARGGVRSGAAVFVWIILA